MGLDPNFVLEKDLKYQIYISGTSFQKINTIIGPYLHPEIVASKWPLANLKESTQSYLRNVNIGRYCRIIEKTPKGNTRVTEKIFDSIFSQVDWELSVILKKNDAESYLKVYNNSEPINKTKCFEKWF